MANDKDFKIKNGLQVGGAYIEKVGTITGNADVDLSTGNVFDYTPTANATFTFSNAGETEHSFVLSVNGVLIDNAYDLANAVAPVQPGKFSVAAQDAVPQGIFLKPDGTKMYIVGGSGRDINEYTLSTAWDISTASYIQNFSVNAQESTPSGVSFKPDGTKMYVIGFNGDDINEYTLSIAWDISTASYTQNFSVAAQDTAPYDLFFKPDGTKVYTIGASANDVNEYSLSTAWDISTASYVQAFSVSAQETNPNGVFFKTDGTKMYVVGSTGDDVNEYSLSTAWDISTASYVQNFSVSGQDTSPLGMFFKEDGLRMYIMGNSSDAVYSYTLTTAWDISTASLDLPTEGYFSVAAQQTSPTDLFFKPDGTKMYILGYSGHTVNEYDLNTAWEVSSASYVQNFSVTTEETSPAGLFFKPDGTKMYVIGNSGDDVNEYTLSSAWDITTASYVQNFSVATETLSPRNVFFKPDGTRMYICAFEEGAFFSKILEYSLSSAWDISTASLTTNLNYSSIYPAYEAQPSALAFNADGTKMYVAGSNGDTVVEYTLGTPWSISTASKASAIIFSVVSEESTPWGLFFGDNGTRMYIVGLDSDAVWQYSTGTYGEATLTYPASVKFPSGTAPAAPADGETDILEFSTTDGGTTWYGVRTGDAMA